MRLKGTECSELCGLMYVKPSVLKSHAARIRDQSIPSARKPEGRCT